MLVDLILMNDEVKLLAFRLKYLSPVVDKFVIFESKRSFSGRFKKCFAEDAIKLSGISRDKVQVVEYEFPENLLATCGEDRWPLERFARKQIEVFSMQLSNSDFLLISDLDEIPSRNQVMEARESGITMLLPTPLYYRFANWAVPHGSDWKTAKVLPKSRLTSINELRYEREYKVTRSEPGCHFSYLGLTSTDLFEKLSDIAHIERSVSEKAVKRIFSFSNKYAVDHLGRFDRKGFGLLSQVDLAELGSVQRCLMELFPENFNFDPVEYNRLTRMYASFKLWDAWKSRQFSRLTINADAKSVFRFILLTFKFYIRSFTGTIKTSLKNLLSIKSR